jgi:hypothetical protein
MPGWQINIDGQNVTRHAEPAAWFDTWTVEDFTEMEKLQLAATHEAAHAVLMSLARVPVIQVHVRTYSELGHCGAGAMGTVEIGPYSTDLGDLCYALAAGERAEERLLHEEDLWTVARAWAVERHAVSDRNEITTVIREHASQVLTYGRSQQWNDLSVIHNHTDHVLDLHWPTVRRLADELAQRRQLSAAQVQDITKIPNPAVPA